MFGLFKNKKEVEQLKEDTKKGFESVKQDISSLGKWIEYLNDQIKDKDERIKQLEEQLSTTNEEIEEMRNIVSMMGHVKNQQPFKQPFQTPKQALPKQTAVEPVETGVETGVETPNLDNFSLTERAIIWVLLNSDMKLSYEDVASLLGKEKTTIRGQINRIKSKSESLVKEVIEDNGKKRIHIPGEIKKKMLKKSKVRVKGKEKDKTKESEY
ncbi:MAG: hypothetical protein ABEI74_02700 [Candidatus Pacearchaeota archaeon]